METYQDLAYKGDLRVGMKIILHYNLHRPTPDHRHETVRIVRKDYAEMFDGWIVNRKEDGSWGGDCNNGYLTLLEITNWREEMKNLNK